MAHGHRSPSHKPTSIGALPIAFFVGAFAVHEMGAAAFLFILAIGGIIVAAACQR